MWAIGVIVVVAVVLLIVGVLIGMIIARKWKCYSKKTAHTYEDISEIVLANRPIAARNPQQAVHQDSPQQGNIELQENIAYRPIAARNPQQAMHQEPLDSPQQGNIELQENIAYRTVQ